MFVVPLAFMIFMLSEVTFFDPDKLWAFLLENNTPAGFPAAMQFTCENPDLIEGLLLLCQRYPELVLGRRPVNPAFVLLVPSDQVPKGVACFHAANEDGMAVAEFAEVHIVDSLLQALQHGDPDDSGDPRQIALDLMQGMCEHVILSWIEYNFPTEVSKAVH